jgi:hypothetical protein
MGTKKGCDCSDAEVDSFNMDLSAGACSKNETTYGCVTVEEKPAKVLKVYKNSNICGKRGNVNFINVKRPNLNGECPELTKACGHASANVSHVTCMDE